MRLPLSRGINRSDITISWLVGWCVCLRVCVCVCSPARGESDVPVGCRKRYRRIIPSLPPPSLPPSSVFPFTPTRYSKTNRTAIVCNLLPHTHTPTTSMHKDNQAQPYLSWTKNVIQVKTFLVHTNTFTGTEMCTHAYNMHKNLQISRYTKVYTHFPPPYNTGRPQLHIHSEITFM